MPPTLLPAAMPNTQRQLNAVADRLSVVIPTYNRRELALRALQSVLDQVAAGRHRGHRRR